MVVFYFLVFWSFLVPAHAAIYPPKKPASLKPAPASFQLPMNALSLCWLTATRQVPLPVFVNNQWYRASSAINRVVHNPATAEMLALVPDSDANTVDFAVGAARSAYKDWREFTSGARAEYLEHIAHALKQENTRIQLARLMTLETGKPYSEAYDEIGWTAEAFSYYAGLVKSHYGENLAPMSASQFNFTNREPLGVVAAIVPFNFPLLLMSWKVAPALAMGNTIVLKPPHQNPLTGLLFAQILGKILPPGVFNVITGAGSTGQLLTEHPEVNVVAFTGSTAVGEKIAESAGRGLKKVHLELGGLDPLIVMDDVPLDIVAKNVAWARGLNGGQVCTSPKRIIVLRSVADKFTRLLIDEVSQLKVGDPRDPKTDIGPMISAEAVGKLELQVRETLREGAHLAYGGEKITVRVGGKALGGYFFQPTVLTGIKEGMLPTREEVFGPVYQIMVAEDGEDAIRIANSTRYALGASVFSKDIEFIRKASRELIAGTVWFNSALLDDNIAGPFGGPYLTGDGRELGIEGLNSFSTTKTTIIESKLFDRPDGFPYVRREMPGAFRSHERTVPKK